MALWPFDLPFPIHPSASGIKFCYPAKHEQAILALILLK